MKGISLLLYKNEQLFDITMLVVSITWKGRKGAAARSIGVTLMNDSQRERAGIDVEDGQQCVFGYNGEELFRGMIETQRDPANKTMTFTAYDNGVYLANNKDTYCYSNKTATDVFKDCCARYEIPYSEVTQTKHRIAELIKPNTTAFDAICNALQLDYENTGVRHFMMSKQGKLNLITRRENVLQWVIEPGRNLINYTYQKSIEGVKTRVKIISKENTVVAEKINPDLEKRIGIRQDIERPKDDIPVSQYTELASKLLDEKSLPKRSLDVEALGLADVISGIGAYIILPDLDISRTFYVDEDMHTFNGDVHTMKLKLNFATDIGVD